MTGKILKSFGIILVACIFCLCGIASAATSVSVLPSVGTVTPGEEFTLDIYVKPDTFIAGVQLDLDFDASLVSIESIEEGNLLSNSGSPVMFNPGTIDNDAGTASQVYGTIIMGDGTDEEATFCTIKLKASNETGNCQIRIENIVVGDKQGDEVDAITYDGMISITDETEIADRNTDNNDDSDSVIVVRQNTNTDSSINEDTGSSSASEEETTLQSVQDTAESTESQEIASAPEAKTSTSNVGILAVAAIAFLALAFVLDRKRK